MQYFVTQVKINEKHVYVSLKSHKIVSVNLVIDLCIIIFIFKIFNCL